MCTEAFTRKLADAVQALRVGEALQGETEQGPLINAAALAKVEQHVGDALEHGARLLCGGRRHALGGTFYEPTVLAEATTEMLIANEETFGPVAACFRFQDEAQVLRLANDTPYGLSAYFYSRDIGRVWRMAEGLEAGIVGVNEGIISTEVAPFGGHQGVGHGPRRLQVRPGGLPGDQVRADGWAEQLIQPCRRGLVPRLHVSRATQSNAPDPNNNNEVST